MTRALVIGAHSDDQALGAGGTIAKLSEEGGDVHTLILSDGEQSHPHLDPDEVRKMRRGESRAANQILGATTSFVGITEGQFREEEGLALKHIKKALTKYNPDIVFTHSPDDFHPDHRATYDLVTAAYDDVDSVTTDVFVFDIWTVWNTKKRGWPRYYVGIDDYYPDKIEALHEFTSQIDIFSHTILNHYVYLKQYVTAAMNGFRTDEAFAELFYKAR